MGITRSLTRIETPAAEPGFLGAGHTARRVVSGGFAKTDPFIMLMDDLLDKKDTVPSGGPHPHAGFETVSLLLEGEFGDETHKMKGGDFEIMTAGSGIVHTETIDKKVKLRLLQLWLNLPTKDRWTTPRLQNLPAQHAPESAEKGVAIKVYSGSLAGLTSPVQNYSPLIVADIRLDGGVSTTVTLPGNYNTFIYVIEGSVTVGAQGKLLSKDQVGWLDVFADITDTDLRLTATSTGVRFVLYAGQPTGEEIVSHGPFIADSIEEIKQLYSDYRMGKMKHIGTVPESQRIML